MTRRPVTFPVVAVLSAFGSALAFGGVGLAVHALGGRGPGMVAGALVMTLAGMALVVPATRPLALLLTWNGLGIAIGLLLLGIFSVGALMAFPLALIVLTLASWPLEPGESIASVPAMIVQVAGFVLVLSLYGVPGNPFSWFAALT